MPKSNLPVGGPLTQEALELDAGRRRTTVFWGVEVADGRFGRSEVSVMEADSDEPPGARWSRPRVDYTFEGGPLFALLREAARAMGVGVRATEKSS